MVSGIAQEPANLVIPWFVESLAHDLEVRETGIAIFNVGYFVQSWVVPLIAWQTVDAPRYYGGYTFITVYSIPRLIILPIPFFLERRDKRKIAQHSAISDPKNAAGSDIDIGESNSFGAVTYDKEARVEVKEL